MSVTALKPALSAIAADGHITLEDAKTLTSPKNLGAYTDKDEFALIKGLAADVKVGNQLDVVTSDTVKEVNAKNKARLVHKGVKIGSAVGAFGMVGGVIASAALVSAPAALGIGAAVLGAAAGIGALVGAVRSRRNPISANEIKEKTPLALAAATFKKNPRVERGIKNAGVIVGAICGVVAVASTIALSGAILGSGAAGAMQLLIYTGPVLGALAGVAVIGVGLGALVGYIRSKIKGDSPVVPTTAAPEAAALLEETLKKGVTAKDYVKKGTQIGKKVGGVLAGLGVAAYAVSLVVGMVTGTGTVAGALTFGGLAFISLGIILLVGVGLCMGIGTLSGWIYSKVKTQED
jgi:hypothetical protein